MGLLPEVICATEESKAELQTYLTWVDAFLQSPEANMAQAMDRHTNFSGELRYYIQQHNEPEVLGAIGLLIRDIDVPFFEIGYWVRSSASGKGYIAESLNLLEQHAINDLNAKRLEIRMAKCNRKSQSVAIRAGYTLEAELRNERRLPSRELTNTLIYTKPEL